MAGKMIAVGDNVVDCYLDDHVYYPGGNAVNVAVNCRRDGIEDVAYIGMFGNDGKAEHLKWALTQENVHFERSRTMYAPSGSPGVRLIDGDRKFVGGPRDTAQHVARIRLTPEDLDYIEQYGLCHTSCFSSIEYELPEMAKRCQVSFDFSERTDPDYLARVCPYVTYAFFSGSHMTRSPFLYQSATNIFCASSAFTLSSLSSRSYERINPARSPANAFAPACCKCALSCFPSG